jgi:hypothetical protein
MECFPSLSPVIEELYPFITLWLKKLPPRVIGMGGIAEKIAILLLSVCALCYYVILCL